MSTQTSNQYAQLVSNSRSEEEIRRKRRKRKRVVVVLAVSIMAIIANRYHRRRPRHIVDANEALERNVEGRKQMLRNLYQGSNTYCYDSLRLTKTSFYDLCALLRVRCGLQDTLNVSVEEKVAIFLLIVGQDTKMRLIRSTYGWSLEPISRHFNEVLRGILSLSHEFIKLPDPATVLPEDPKWKWFEDCLGALDGTHIDVNVPLADQGRYRNRKQRITTNVLGVCDRNMKFLYVLAGWEGSASDSRILRDAMSREDAFVVPSGKYYLGDAGYTNGPGFLTPYRSTRYHLNEWAAQGNNPTTARELFNLRHATARNVVERTFGLLKMRWAILRTSSYFDLENQIRIIHACCILHNFLRDRQHDMDQQDMDNELMEQVDNDISAALAENQGEMITQVQSTNEWGHFRDTKANEMFADYQARRGQQKSSRGYVPWNDEMDKVLLDTFVEYFNRGDRCQNGWKPHVYTAAVKNVREKCNVNITKSNIESRSKTFDKHYHIITGLLSTSGFGWDWDKNKLKVDSDSVWDDYVERNKDAKGYRHKIVKFWDLLSVVYNKDQANGEAARTAAESSKEMAREIGTGKDTAGSASTTTSSLKRQRSDDSFNSLWSEKLDKLTATLKDDAPKLPSSAEVLAALQEIEGLDEDTELDLYDILTADARKFESMMALPVERRKRWLMKQLRK